MESEQLIRGKVPQLAHKNEEISQDESLTEIEMYRYLHNARDIKEFIARVKTILLRSNITDFSHSLLDRISGGLDPCGTYGPAVTDEYAKEGLHHGDLATRHLLINDDPIFRSTVCQYIDLAPFDNDLFRHHREGTRFMKKHGLLDVYNIPISEDGYRALFSVSSHNCEPEQFQQIISRSKKTIHALAGYVDAVGRKKFKKHFHSKKGNDRVPIRPRSLQLLETLANKDLTLNEAALVLNMSISTANQHIAAAKKDLKSHTIHGAILTAEKEGLILIEKE